MHLLTAIAWFFKILFKGKAAFSDAPAPDGEKPVFHHSPAPAVQVLGLLQKEGRLLDFLMEDLSGYNDAEVGGAVRDIHRGCRQALDQYFTLRRVLEQSEGEAVTIEAGYDPSAIELQGSVGGEPPIQGSLIHGGWYAEEVKLPTIPEGADPNVATPAQVEVSA